MLSKARQANFVLLLESFASIVIMVFLFIAAIEVLTETLEGAGPSAPREPDGTMFFSRGCKGLQPSRSIASKPAEGKISIWMRKRKRGAWRLPVKGRGLSPVYSQPARSAHPAGSPVFGSKINRCARCRVSKSNILTSEPASASKELLPIAPRSQLSSMNRRTEV